MWFLGGYLLLLALSGALIGAAARAPVFPGDLLILQSLQSWHHPLLELAMRAISTPGYRLPAFVILGAVFLGLVWGRRPWEGVFLLLTGFGYPISLFLKALIARPRPPAPWVRVLELSSEPGFPSGHVVHFVLFYGFLFYLMLREMAPSWRRSALLALFAFLVVLIGPSRLYLGVHWPSDVLGGYALGFSLLLPLIVAHQLWGPPKNKGPRLRPRPFPKSGDGGAQAAPARLRRGQRRLLARHAVVGLRNGGLRAWFVKAQSLW